MTSTRTRRVMEQLGYAGLLPFYASALWVALQLDSGRDLAVRVFVIYGVVILAFLGGTVWGNAVARPEPVKVGRLVFSNIVALFAALAGLAGDAGLACLLLALGQVGLLVYERQTGDPAGWYLAFRTRLSLGVLPAHGLFLFGVVG